MTTLFLFGDWLLIFSFVILLTDSYRAYFLIPQLERQKRTAPGLAVTTLLTLVLVGIGIINIIHPYPMQYLSFLIYCIALTIWITSAWWRTTGIQSHQNRQLFLLSNILAVTGFLLLIGLFLVTIFFKFP